MLTKTIHQVRRRDGARKYLWDTDLRLTRTNGPSMRREDCHCIGQLPHSFAAFSALPRATHEPTRLIVKTRRNRGRLRPLRTRGWIQPAWPG